ncbi:hypothetical protein [Geodermatophilus sp. SYSU D01176]
MADAKSGGVQPTGVTSEEAFSKIKARVKAAGARTHQALEAAIAAALEAVTPADAAGWLTYAGYLILQPT